MALMLLNKDNGKMLAESIRVADSFLARLKGLWGEKHLPEGKGLILFPCSMVHSLGMKIDIDVLFVSRHHEIVSILEGLRPNHCSPYIKESRYVVELPSGQVARTATRKGHRIELLKEHN